MIHGTTLPLEMETKQKLVELKNHPAETWDQFLTRIVLKNADEDEDLLTAADLVEIKQSIADIEKGMYVTQAQMKKRLGIK